MAAALFHFLFVFPAQAGTQGQAAKRLPWAPAFAGEPS
jgi:hypothetical protein